MARKESDFTATFGRDAGKRYLITEMSAEKAFDWGTKALLAMARSGVDIPDDIEQRGMAGVALVVVKAVGGLEFMAVSSLKSELLACVKVYISAPGAQTHSRPLIDGDIEEAVTIYHLCVAVIELHLGFSIAESLSKLTSRTPSSAQA